MTLKYYEFWCPCCGERLEMVRVQRKEENKDVAQNPPCVWWDANFECAECPILGMTISLPYDPSNKPW